jgi:hypothetical protein
MGDEELVDAYVAGRISRRIFIRRLVAGGLSLAAAMTYGELLRSPALATDNDRFHLHHRVHHRHVPLNAPALT